MDKYLEIKKIFESREDKENAIAMSKYMRNLFDFYGLPTPKRKDVYNNFIKSEKKLKKIDWEFLDKCYEDNHREFQYLVYNLVRRKKMTKLEWLLDLFTWGIHDDIDGISDLSPYYLVKKDNLKLLVNIKDWVLEVVELPSNTNDKKFSYGGNYFINCGKLKLK